MSWIFAVCLYSLALHACTAEAAPSAMILAFEAMPKAFFTDEDTAVFFEARPSSSLEPGDALALVTLDNDGKVLRRLGTLDDHGVFGDARAGDGVYGRKVQFKERRARAITVGVALLKPDGTLELLGPSQGRVRATLDALPRPSFIEAARQAFLHVFRR